MLNGYKIIDADSHVIEPPAMWGQYLEPKFREFAPSADMKIKGEPISQKISPQVQKEGNKQMMQAHPRAYLNRYNPESHVQAMVQMGIDVAFIYPNYGLWLFAIDSLPAEVMGAFVRAYNTWLYEEFCSYDPARLKGVAAVNQHDPEDMVKELHRSANLGWKAVFLRPNPVKGRILSDPAYEPFWAACEDLDMAVGIHEGHWSRLPTTGADRFHTRFALHACSHPMEQMMALLALIEGGVLERHPKLRIGFLESGCGWLPYWLWRLDEEYQVTPWEVKDRVRLMPSEYFRRQCFIAVDPSEPYLSQLIDYIGSDNIIFGSDYPHMDHKPDIVSQIVQLEKDLAKETVEKILAYNPTRFYGSV
ncbi:MULTISPECIES: amidohydrolase family protein [unclassified Microcystis]|jgi:predicted TIM-barrel fold metal-dependent hydrolase|uniref:amidohydrolase family protein n=1 Tax=unclassified Microcystis TaxID=2643300 RepID=UPI0025898EBD|nr:MULTISPECIES: amidohydrolase family protein [unclassified Microcystis]MCA2762629.1 amidohydrolase [Microcystis sp. M151S2]MCA2640693.1 amidohydrolase [Microcystis sp. M087S2]MCA2672364.1 amidohydrolase [Microcystis sp. M080S2]MCA2733060.1 amidohydrolase [Microcystis sp. M158S2]MCA2737790.1 amidohydrolase [Microcystis sp. M165S2]